MRLRFPVIRLAHALAALLLILLAVRGRAQTAATLSPTPNLQFFDTSTGIALPCVNCTLSTFAAGTNTPLKTFVDSTATTQNGVVITLNAQGYSTSGIWIGSACYKYTLANAAGGVIWSQDHICGDAGLSAAITLLTNQLASTGIFDYSYNSLATACSAAVSAGKLLILTKQWTSVPTQTLACNILGLTGGSIQPAAGAVVTITGSFGAADVSTHFDTSAGGAVNIATMKVAGGMFQPQWLGAAGPQVFADAVTAGTTGPVTVIADGNYNAFPGITTKVTGDLIAVYRKGTSHASDKGSIYKQTSTDRGLSWSAQASVYTDASLDSRDPGILRLADGTCLVDFFKYNLGTTLATQTFSLKSTDAACTSWGSPVQVSVTAQTAESGPPVQLANGNILIPTYGPDGIQVFRSTNNAASWSLLATVDPSTAASEPIIALRSSGNLVMTIRDYPTGFTGIATSTDSGATWSGVTGSVFISASRAAVIEAPDGCLLASYRTNYPNVTEVIDHQMGMRRSCVTATSWDAETLTAVSTSTWFLYSAVTAMPNGLAGTVYCLQGATASIASCYFSYLGSNEILPLQTRNANGLVNSGIELMTNAADARIRTQTVDKVSYFDNGEGATYAMDITGYSATHPSFSWRFGGVEQMSLRQFANRFCLGTKSDCDSGVISPFNVIRADGGVGDVGAFIFGPTGTGVRLGGGAAGTNAVIWSEHNSGSDVAMCITTAGNRATGANRFCELPSGGYVLGNFSGQDPGLGKTAMIPPTSCAGMPTNTIWNNSGTLALCP